MRLAWVLLALVLLVGAVAALAWQDLKRFAATPLSLPAEGTALDIPRGASIRSVAVELEQRGLLPRPAPWLRAWARYTGQAQRIRAGEYHLAPGLTPQGLLDQLVAGQVVQHQLALIPGWDFEQVMAALRAHPALDQTLPAQAPRAELAAAVSEALDLPGHPAGRVLPDTYHFPRGTSDVAFLARARDALNRTLELAWQERSEDLPLETPDQALILASIIEKETGLAAERPRIAGVFVRRLQRGMRLQTDPTVIYGVTHGLGQAFDGNLTRAHLRADNPYNTYTRHGLPPRPIALASAEAIHAALNPADGDALYFVARGDGSHVFSATLKAHNRAVRRFQLGR